MARGYHRAVLPPAWLRLEGRTVEPDGMTLEFEVSATEEGRGQPLSLFAELLAPGDLVRVKVKIKPPRRTVEVTVEIGAEAADDGLRETGVGGGGGTPAAEVNSLGPPEDTTPPLPAVGELIPILPMAAPASGSPPTESGAADLIPVPPAPEERQVAITQELAPLEPGTCGCGCGGELQPNAHGGLARFLLGHGTRLRSAELRQQAGAKAGATKARREYHSAADPAHVAELKAQVAAGKYQPFAQARKAARR